MGTLIPPLDDVTDPQGAKTELDLVLPDWKELAAELDATVTYAVAAERESPAAAAEPRAAGAAVVAPAPPVSSARRLAAAPSLTAAPSASCISEPARSLAAAPRNQEAPLAPAPVLAPPPEDQLWEEPERRRAIPRRVKIGAGVAALGLALFMAVGGKHSERTAEKRLVLADDMVVNEADLKKRREVSADDFRPRHESEHTPLAVHQVPAAPAQSEEPASVQAEDLAARRARRSDDPEDVMSRRQRHNVPAAAATSAPEPAGAATAEPNLYRRASVLAPTSPAPRATSSTSAAAEAAPSLAAGSTIAGELVTPLELGAGSSSVVVRVAKGPYRGARFLGTASLSSAGRVVMNFRKLVLADGRETRVDAEAQDVDGAFGLAADVKETGNEEPSVMGNVASDTVEDVADSVLGVSIPGRAASSYLRQSRMQGSRRRGYSRTATLAAATPVVVFLQEAAEIR